jgi:hypothetical protein
VEHQLAAGRGGVDRLVKAAEPDPTLGELSDGVDQVPEERPRRSSFQTTSVSPGRSWSRTWARVGRSARAPLLGRQYLPRTADLRQFSQADLGRIAAELNGRPSTDPLLQDTLTSTHDAAALTCGTYW